MWSYVFGNHSPKDIAFYTRRLQSTTIEYIIRSVEDTDVYSSL